MSEHKSEEENIKPVANNARISCDFLIQFFHENLIALMKVDNKVNF